MHAHSNIIYTQDILQYAHKVLVIYKIIIQQCKNTTTKHNIL